ncbi:MAG: LysM domain-containing protein [Actinomycetota bacterium]
MRFLRLAALAVTDGWALVALLPDWWLLRDQLAAPHDWVRRAGADAAATELASAALWLVALWLAIGLLAILASVLPGTVGRVAHHTADSLLPAVLIRVVASAAGVGVLVGSAAPGAAGAQPPARPSAGTVAFPSPSWPTDTAATSRIEVGWPGAPALPAGTPSVPPASSPPSAAHDADVTVAKGDSLWLIAARRLGPDAAIAAVAAAWPRWYATNRSVIGADPGLIVPGQLLHPPAPAAPH